LPDKDASQRKTCGGAAKLTKTLADFSLHLTSVFIAFVLIALTKLYLNSTPALYDSHAQECLMPWLTLVGGVDAPFLFSFNI
jgi:hypothetical protein